MSQCIQDRHSNAGQENVLDKSKERVYKPLRMYFDYNNDVIFLPIRAGTELHELRSLDTVLAGLTKYKDFAKVKHVNFRKEYLQGSYYKEFVSLLHNFRASLDIVRSSLATLPPLQMDISVDISVDTLCAVPGLIESKAWSQAPFTDAPGNKEHSPMYMAKRHRTSGRS